MFNEINFDYDVYVRREDEHRRRMVLVGSASNIAEGEIKIKINLHSFPFHGNLVLRPSDDKK